MKPQAWIMIPLSKAHELLGYAEAVAKVARGESLFPKIAKRPAPARRPLSELVSQRDRLAAQLAQFGASGPVDTAAARLNAAGMRRHYKNTDAELARYTSLQLRLSVVDSEIIRHPDNVSGSTTGEPINLKEAHRG